MKSCRCDCSSAECGFSKGWPQHKEGGGEQNRRPQPQHALRKEDHSRGDEIVFFHGSSASSYRPELEARSLWLEAHLKKGRGEHGVWGSGPARCRREIGYA